MGHDYISVAFISKTDGSRKCSVFVLNFRPPYICKLELMSHQASTFNCCHLTDMHPVAYMLAGGSSVPLLLAAGTTV